MSVTTFYYSNSTTSTSTDTTLTAASYSVPSGFNLTRVDVGTAVTTIGNDCFFLKSSLATVNFLNTSTVSSLNIRCFAGTGLTSIEIPNSVTSIGSNILRSCNSLTTIKYLNPSAITATSDITDVNNLTVQFYSTPSAPDPPVPANGVYNTTRYTGTGETFQYFSAACYNIDTLVLAFKDNQEQYVKIQDLRKNDLIKTYNDGYRPIKLIGKSVITNNPSCPRLCMYHYNGLYITGGHSILVDEFCRKKIEDKYLRLCCDDKRFEKITNNDNYTVFHLVLEGEKSRYGIYVNNGILSETIKEEVFLEYNFTEI
jgi:hypothetical protein